MNVILKVHTKNMPKKPTNSGGKPWSQNMVELPSCEPLPRRKVKSITRLNSSIYADDSIYLSSSTHMSKNILKIILIFGEKVSGNLIDLDKPSIIHYHENHKDMENEKHSLITNINVKFETFKYSATKSISDFEQIEATTLLVDAKVIFYLSNSYITDECLDELQIEIDSVMGLTKIFNKTMFKEIKKFG
eukprot:Pgem_evm3s19520